jgi:hypothetical protein
MRRERPAILIPDRDYTNELIDKEDVRKNSHFHVLSRSGEEFQAIAGTCSCNNVKLFTFFLPRYC